MEIFKCLLKSKKTNSYQIQKWKPSQHAIIESFYRTIKRELTLDAHYETPKEAQKGIFKYIEFYYNTNRMHSSLSYISSAQFEKQNAHNSLNFVSIKA